MRSLSKDVLHIPYICTFFGDFSSSIGADCFKHAGKTGLFSVQFSGKHRTSGNKDCRDVETGGCHQQSRHIFVAVWDHAGDKENLREELGDLMMQVVFHARIEEEEGSFDLDDVADAACKKLVFRHPHVFGDIHCENSEEVLKTWDEVKRLEKSQKTVTSTMEGVAENLPALWRAEKIQKKASVTGFQWPDTSYAFNKIAEETEELRAAVEENDADSIEEELGDLLFAAVSLARLTETDPEKALHRACEKAIRRFRYMEEIAIDEGEAMEEMGLQKMLEIYKFAKEKEKQIFLDK